MDNQDARPSQQKIKHFLGMLFFWLSWLLWIPGLVIPFVLEAEAATIAAVSGSLLVAAEISFALSLLLLGRPFYQALKQRLKFVWCKVVGKQSD